MLFRTLVDAALGGRSGCLLQSRAVGSGGGKHEENLSTEPSRTQAPPWFSGQDGDQEWAQGPGAAARQGAEASLRLTGRRRAWSA
jgi:hypothetical protein